MKKTLAIIALLLSVIFVFSGCSQNVGENTKATTDSVYVTDLNGNNVKIPEVITGMASNAASVTTHIVMICGSDIVKIAPASFDSGHTEDFDTMFPGTNSIIKADGNKISAEKLIESGVNVFFTTKQEEADEYGKAGLTCIVLNYDSIETIAETFRLIGTVFGGDAKEKAERISQHILESKSYVEENSVDSSDSDRPTVYYIAASTQTTPYLTQGNGTSIDTLLDMCGANLISPGKGLDVQVNPEFLLDNDPDYILIDGYLAKEAYEVLLNDPVLKDLNAVKNNHIVIAPVGYFRPILRPGAESGIGLLWLAKTFGNHMISEDELEKRALKFYNDCFEFDLTEQDIHSMLNWAE